jgi:TetR/AcrR family transcriptional regulator, transcriptional repressor for nem operon
VARPREFVEADVITKATALFWSRGYHAVTIDDVLSAIEMARQSFYNTFVDKRQLLLLCLRQYRDAQLAVLKGCFAQADGTTGFRAVFDSVLNEPDSGKRRGCFMLSTSSELASVDVQVSDMAAEFQVAVEDLFASRLLASADGGGEPVDPRVADAARYKARHLAVVYFGLRAMVKADPRSSAVTDASRHALALIAESKTS